MALGGVAVFCIVLGVLMFLPGKSNEDAGRYTISKTEPVKLSDSNSELRLIENTSNSENIPTSKPTDDSTAKITLNGVESTDQSVNPPASTAAASGLASVAALEPVAVATSSLASSQTSGIPTSTTVDSTTESKPIVIVAAPETAENNKEPVPVATNAATESAVIQAPEATAAPIEQAEPQKNDSTSNSQIGVLESSSWILLQDRALYTVQMSASRDRDSVVNFLNAHSDALPAPNSIYTFARNGSDWYALLHGLYESIDTARAAVEAMPAKALTNQPWIRSVARVQEVLKAQ
jgi:DamX protein